MKIKIEFESHEAGAAAVIVARIAQGEARLREQEASVSVDLEPVEKNGTWPAAAPFPVDL